ncbi:hypothetical protein HF086_014713 [Spodoptera exigua]|uniref:peptidylprolyl isomerase n=1 Tax=Spodoptera exigua TaxID=7107 RepID=A0A922SBK5_SPOEX|nr:hypothetical protein HF086_014713 [Spodoptera exigua]
MSAEKRRSSVDEKEESDENDGWIGPMPSEASKPKPKKRKVLEFESLYIENLPSSETYEFSYMHRDVVTHIVVTKTDFVITASQDGHLKFWKKQEEGIEFVKHFRCHLAPISHVATNTTGTLLCTASPEKTIKVFDVINFDMINMISIEFEPYIADSEKASNKIHIFDGTQTSSTPLHTFQTLHQATVTTIKYNPVYETAVSVDKAGIIEYWTGPKHEYQFPKTVNFESKLDTDLYDFVKNKTYPTALAFSPDGKKMASISLDRKVRVFHFLSGKLHKVLDESLQRFQDLQHQTQQLPNMEFGRRMAAERDLEKSDSVHLANVLFDASGHFVIYATMLGVKVVNLVTNRCVAMLGKPENLRPLHLALLLPNPIILNPTLVLHYYSFETHEYWMQSLICMTRRIQRLYEQAILHTSLGDVHIRIFGKDVPKTAENFCVHSRNGYYNGHVFHRVIKGFMVQTGDPTESLETVE